MRSLPIIPIAVTLLAMLLVDFRQPGHLREIEIACLITGAITTVASIIMVLVRRRNTMTVVQTALGTTVGQMMLSGLGGVIVYAMGFVSNLQAFALWLLAFFWIQLIVLSLISIRVIRQAKPGGQADEPMDRTVKCL
jgi:hypothetical protein